MDETWGVASKEGLDRACSNCGVRYPADEPVCPNCFTPAARSYSRLRGGPLSFSPLTKLAIGLVLAGLAAGHAVYVLGTVGAMGIARVVEVSIPLLLPIPFLFRRTRVR